MNVRPANNNLDRLAAGDLDKGRIIFKENKRLMGPFPHGVDDDAALQETGFSKALEHSRATQGGFNRIFIVVEILGLDELKRHLLANRKRSPRDNHLLDRRVERNGQGFETGPRRIRPTVNLKFVCFIRFKPQGCYIRSQLQHRVRRRYTHFRIRIDDNRLGLNERSLRVVAATSVAGLPLPRIQTRPCVVMRLDKLVECHLNGLVTCFQAGDFILGLFFKSA